MTFTGTGCRFVRWAGVADGSTELPCYLSLSTLLLLVIVRTDMMEHDCFEDSQPRGTSWWDSMESRRLKSLSTHSRNQWLALLMGQAIALLAASMNAASYTLISKFNVQTQMFQMFFLYILLSLSLGRRPQGNAVDANVPGDSYRMPLTSLRLRAPWWIYLLCSMLDIFPNFLSLLSLKYTSLTSATLLGSLTVPSTMFFSKLMLGKSFRPIQYLGVCLCVVGGMLTMLSDTAMSSGGGSESEGTTSSSRHGFLGDAMAIGAAMCYGLGDTIAEYFVKHVEREEFLGMLGLYGLIFTGVAFPILEHAALRDIFQQATWSVFGVFLWYILSVYLYYTTETSFLITSDATLLNLSLQAANLWALLFSVVVDQQSPPTGLFFVAAALVVVGVFVYEMVQRSDHLHLSLEHRPTALSQEEVAEGGVEGDADEVDLQERVGDRRGGNKVFQLPSIQLSS